MGRGQLDVRTEDHHVDNALGNGDNNVRIYNSLSASGDALRRFLRAISSRRSGCLRCGDGRRRAGQAGRCGGRGLGSGALESCLRGGQLLGSALIVGLATGADSHCEGNGRGDRESGQRTR